MSTKSAKATTQLTAPRLLEQYRKEIAPALGKTLHQSNLMAVPRLNKIVLNVGCGEAAHDAKILEAVQRDLALIAGQRPIITRAKRAISNFRIKEGDPVGCKVTLRRARMYEFFERLIHVALPRIRDFQGLSPRGFDQQGGYSFGIVEHTIFPEVNLDEARFPFGLDIAIVTNATGPQGTLALLTAFGVPFTRSKTSNAPGAPAEAAAAPEDA